LPPLVPEVPPLLPPLLLVVVVVVVIVVVVVVVIVVVVERSLPPRWAGEARRARGRGERARKACVKEENRRQIRSRVEPIVSSIVTVCM